MFRTIARRPARAAIFAAAALATSASANHHLMQIQQVIGGVNGDTSAQAVQLRMRSGGQAQMQNGKLWAHDANGANPVLLIDFSTPVANAGAGVTVLVTTANFANHTTTTLAADYTMNPIPASYLAAGRITFENNAGSSIWWSLAYGGAGYTGSTAGAITNDPDGDFGPPTSMSLPTTGIDAINLQIAATAQSSTNLADYAMTSGGSTWTNNAGTSFELAPPGDCPGDATGDNLVDINDLNQVLGNFGNTGAPGIPGDLTGDGNVDINDLNAVLGNFGNSCP